MARRKLPPGLATDSAGDTARSHRRSIAIVADSQTGFQIFAGSIFVGTRSFILRMPEIVPEGAQETNLRHEG